MSSYKLLIMFFFSFIFIVNQGSVSVEFNEENKGYLYNNYEKVQDIVESSNTNNPNTSKLPSLLQCYDCNSIHDGESCFNMSENKPNIKQCYQNETYCKVSTFLLWITHPTRYLGALSKREC